MAWVLCAVFAFAAAAVAQDGLQPVPELHERITDLTATLDAAQKRAIEDKLAALEQRKGAQIGVLIVATTAPETIEQFATRVFDAWKLGRKNVDDGVLVLVAKDDRRVRIEVAYGLEGAIPDAAAKRVAHDYMSPRFAQGDFAGGISAGVDALVALIDDEPLPAAPATATARRSTVVTDWWSPAYIVAGMILGGVSGVILLLIFGRPRIHRALLGRVPQRVRPYAIGVVNALLIGILLGNVLAGVTALAAGAFLASIAGLAATPSLSRRRGFASVGGSSSGDSGSSGSSSSGGGSSDFSGGGGSSGGGGASDSW
jgi:uncharacterized protein